MPGLFSKVFKKDGTPKKPLNGADSAPAKPRWGDAWQRVEVEPEEVQELLRGCTQEIKSRALDIPFLLLPFRPASDPSAARTFVRNFFGPGLGTDPPMSGTKLATELRLAEPLVLCSVIKWCWSRLSGGVVTWDAYELFKMGENDSNMARDAFSTFIPISVANDARTKIISDFFELMAAIAANGKSNGFPGRKLSRYAAWWAFEHKTDEEGFDGGYRSWSKAADATMHLFFAYLRSLSPDEVQSALSLPRSLLQLLEQTEYPPRPEHNLASKINKVVMIVDKVSPTPFALLRRARNFEYSSDDEILQAFSEFDDPVRAIAEECKRILQGIATANESSNSKLSTSLRDASWSRFEDIGFSESNDDDQVKDGILSESALTKKRSQRFEGLQSMPSSTVDVGRPTTPSCADFMSSGFNEQGSTGPASLLPPDKQLPPLSIRGSTSYSERHAVDESTLGSGELASINRVTIDDVFWWVWITSLSSEETPARKSAFGRCAFIETKLRIGTWLLFEEVIKGAKAEPANTGYVAEKKSRFGFRKISKKVLKGTPTKGNSDDQNGSASPSNRKTLAPDQHARIQAAAAALSQKKANSMASTTSPGRRGRMDAEAQSRTTSVLTLQPNIMNEATTAMKWASSYDKNEVRSQYLGNKFAGKGSAVDLASAENKSNAPSTVSREPPHVEPVAAPEPAPVAATAGTPKKPQAQVSNAPTPTRKPVATGADLPKTPIKTAGVVPPLRTSSRGKTDEFMSGPEYGKQTLNGPEPTTSPVQTSPTSATKTSRLPGRLGSVFGRKKTDEDKEKPMPKPVPVRTVSNSNGAGSAVAAARAALEAKTQQAAAAPKQQVTTKRTSLVAEPTQAVERSEPGDQFKSPQAAAAAAAIQMPISEPTMNPDHFHPDRTYAPSYTTDSHIDEAEHDAAEREFSKFDHGPMGDSPALDHSYVSKDSPVSDFTDEHVDTDAHEYGATDLSAAQLANTVPEAPSTEVIAQAAEREADGEEPGTRARALSNERWAQIRKNAAERVAARQNDDTWEKTPNTEEDGETSGEETIESRVARIKARVAELTGNMEVPSHESARSTEH